MFGFGAAKEAKETLPKQTIVSAGYIGKLPSHADFVSANHKFREVNEVDQVLNGLYSELKQKGDEISFSSHFFCRIGGGDRQTIMGAIHSSQDSVNRQYPYIDFMRYTDPRLYFQPDFAMLAACQQMIPSFEWLYCEFDKPVATLQLDSLSRDLEKQVVKHDWLILLQKQLSVVTTQNMFVQLVGADFSFWRKQLACCLLLMQEFIANPYAKMNVGIWLPIGSKASSGPISQFWLGLLTALTHKDWRPDLFWTQQIVDNRLYVLCRPMTTSVVASIVADAGLKRFTGWGDLLSTVPTEKLLTIEAYLSDRYTDEDWMSMSLLDLSSDLIASLEPMMAKRK